MFTFTVHHYLVVILILIIGIKLVGAPARFTCQLDSPACGLFSSSWPFTTFTTLCTPHLLPLFPQRMLEFIKLMFYYTEGKSLNFTSKCNQNELLQLLCLYEEEFFLFEIVLFIFSLKSLFSFDYKRERVFSTDIPKSLGPIGLPVLLDIYHHLPIYHTHAQTLQENLSYRIR